MIGELKEKEFNQNDYNKLLKLIENNSVKKYESYNDFGDNLLNEFSEKSEELDDYGIIVNKFLNKLSIIFNKEKIKNLLKIIKINY